MPVSLSIIAAMDENRLIGSANALPWHLPADLAFFKRTTMDKPIIMGRKTFESIGRPLPGRRNIVISRDPAYRIEGVDTCGGIDDALALVATHDEAMLIGGASLYEQTIDIAKALYITEIHDKFEGDAWFPRIDPALWEVVWREPHEADESNPHAFTFVKYARRAT
jgi:dihydrofolate reductase